MVDFLTPDLLRREAGRLPVNEQAAVRKAQRQDPKGSTFLSHSSADADRLPPVISILEAHGAAIYVDKKDASLPIITSRATADGLKQKIISSRKFVLLTSPTSRDSRWMPWELGVADGYKGLPQVAILPSPEHADEQVWASQEYLGVYDRIVYGNLQGRSEPVFMVLNWEANSAVELSAWLAR